MALEHTRAELRNQRHELFLLKQQHEQDVLQAQIRNEKQRTDKMQRTLLHASDRPGSNRSAGGSEQHRSNRQQHVRNEYHHDNQFHPQQHELHIEEANAVRLRRLSADRFLDLAATATVTAGSRSERPSDASAAAMQSAAERMLDEDVANETAAECDADHLRKYGATRSSNPEAGGRKTINRAILEGYAEERVQSKPAMDEHRREVSPLLRSNNSIFCGEEKVDDAIRGRVDVFGSDALSGKNCINTPDAIGVSSALARSNGTGRAVARSRSPSPIVSLIRRKALDIFPSSKGNHDHRPSSDSGICEERVDDATPTSNNRSGRAGHTAAAVDAARVASTHVTHRQYQQPSGGGASGEDRLQLIYENLSRRT